MKRGKSLFNVLLGAQCYRGKTALYRSIFFTSRFFTQILDVNGQMDIQQHALSSCSLRILD